MPSSLALLFSFGFGLGSALRIILFASLFTCLALFSCGAQQPPFRASVSFQETAAGRIAFYERGSGPRLLLLTGTGSTMSEWDPALLSLLAHRHRLLLVDYPGVGLSSGRTPASFDQMADQIDLFLEAGNFSQLDVLGWSMGGFVAQRLAVRHPSRVRKLVLAGTNPGGSKAVLGSAEDQRSDSDPDRSDRQVLRELYPRTSRGQREGRAFLRRLERAVLSGEVPDNFSVPLSSQRRQVRAEHAWLSSDANFLELAALELPLLATAGRLDRVTPPVNMRRIARRSGGQFSLFEGSHAFLFSDRRSFARRVDEFLLP